jgi:hypothetical protein
MSTGLFLGIRNSFTDDAQLNASEFIDAINEVVRAHGVGNYIDPIGTPNIYENNLFGRSALDHHSSRVFVDIARLSTERRNSPNLALIRDNPYRVVFLPVDFTQPVVSRYEDLIHGSRSPIWIGSLAGLIVELELLSADLGIPLASGQLANETAEAINDFKPFNREDSIELIENQRTA